MTDTLLYTYLMDLFITLLLAPSQLNGGIAVVVIFLLCFIAVHAIKLSTIGYKTYQKQETSTAADKTLTNKPTTKPKRQYTKKRMHRVSKTDLPAPVYYLVERKTAPPREEEQFYKPKRIEFEDS